MCFGRLQDCEEQKAVRGHPGSGRSSRVGGQVRTGSGRNGRVRVTLPPQGGGSGGGRDRGQARAGRHTSAARSIVVARVAVRVPVRQSIVAAAVPVQQQHRVAAVTATAVGRLAVPGASVADQRQQRSRPLHHRVTAAPIVCGRRQRLLSRAAGGRELDRGHGGR